MHAMTSLSLRSGMKHRYQPLPAFHGSSLELSPTVSLEDLVIALVAVLVALVQHRGSYSVTLGNRTAMFQSPHQMRGSLRWRVTERD
jgi:hypothetical protein